MEMLFDAKNGKLTISGGEMDYIRFGTGKQVLLMLPGLGESIQSLKGMALPMALMYREFAKDFTVYLFSRKTPLPQRYGTRDMARDQAEAMERLGIGKAHVFGVSMGGMIAQWLAIDHPDRVERLVLAVTSAEPNPILIESIEEWMALAQAGDTTGFMRSNLRRMYSDRYCRQSMWLAPILGRLTKPKSYDRFFIQSRACLNHNAAALLPTIRAKTLVIGGEQDLALGAQASYEIAAAIPGASLHMYAQWGHALYEEAKDFHQVVLHFLRKS
jgi:pimeloyl-ACP methyl ester carboxylesterase